MVAAMIAMPKTTTIASRLWPIAMVEMDGNSGHDHDDDEDGSEDTVDGC
jgi:hypothetical protein